MVEVFDVRIEDGKILDERGGVVGEVRYHLKEKRFPVLRATVKGIQRDFDVDLTAAERICAFARAISEDVKIGAVT